MTAQGALDIGIATPAQAIAQAQVGLEGMRKALQTLENALIDATIAVERARKSMVEHEDYVRDAIATLAEHAADDSPIVEGQVAS